MWWKISLCEKQKPEHIIGKVVVMMCIIPSRTLLPMSAQCINYMNISSHVLLLFTHMNECISLVIEMLSGREMIYNVYDVA